MSAAPFHGRVSAVFRDFSWCRIDSFPTRLPAGIPQILLMTKVDKACSLVAEDLKTVYQSVYIQRKVNATTSVLCDDGSGTASVPDQ